MMIIDDGLLLWTTLYIAATKIHNKVNTQNHRGPGSMLYASRL